MNNNTTPATSFQGQPFERNANIHKLDMLSLAALIPLSDAIYELADTPIKVLSRLHELLSKYYQHNREQDIIDILYLIYSILGTEYADAIRILRGNKEARSYFLYGYIANLGELIEELTERSADT